MTEYEKLQRVLKNYDELLDLLKKDIDSSFKNLDRARIREFIVHIVGMSNDPFDYENPYIEVNLSRFIAEGIISYDNMKENEEKRKLLT